MQLAGKRVLVVGLARTGTAAVRFLLERKARVTCTDVRTREEIGEEAARLEEAGCRMRLGGHEREDFLASDLIVVSPGVPLDIPPLREARAAGREIIGEVELGARYIDRPIVAVTGTNGKTTTVRLIGAMLERAGIPHWVGGNIGRPLTEWLLGRSEGKGVAEAEVIVAELSSFQLEAIVHFRPRVAVWTNLTPDHLDRYPDLEAYGRAKARIFSNQTADDYAVIPAGVPLIERAVRRCAAKVLRFGGRADPAPEILLEEDRIEFSPPGPGERERYEAGGRRLPGRHNLENLMCALAAARLCGAPPEAVQGVIDSFEGLEHRVEYVGEIDGVRFYNDSKATTVDSVVRALACFDRPVLLLAGGRDKGTPFSSLREAVERRVRRLFLFGEAAPRMEKALAGTTGLERVRDLEEALLRAWQSARPGEVILLSPACASFDMFRDYEERGRRFKEIVAEIRDGRIPRPA